MGSSGEKKVSLGRPCPLGSLTCPSRPQAAILQQTAEYIFSLEQEKTRLLQQNTQLKRFIQVAPCGGLLLPRCLALFLAPFPLFGLSRLPMAWNSDVLAGCIFPTDLPTSGISLPAWASVYLSVKCSGVGSGRNRVISGKQVHSAPFLAFGRLLDLQNGAHLGLTALGG